MYIHEFPLKIVSFILKIWCGLRESKQTRWVAIFSKEFEMLHLKGKTNRYSPNNHFIHCFISPSSFHSDFHSCSKKKSDPLNKWWLPLSRSSINCIWDPQGLAPVNQNLCNQTKRRKCIIRDWGNLSHCNRWKCFLRGIDAYWSVAGTNL